VTLTSYLVKGFWKAVLCTALIASIAYAYPSRPTDPEALRQQSGNTVLFDHRDTCWTGIAPDWAPAVPGHVIMRVEGGIPDSDWHYRGPAWVRIALDDTFVKDNPRVYVVAFCK
jgi:hypothetical protein